MNASEILHRYAMGRRDFRGVIVRNANLCESSLIGIRFDGADLSGSRFCGARVCAADVRIADLRLADVTGVDWTDTNLAKVIWTEAELWDDAHWE